MDDNGISVNQPENDKPRYRVNPAVTEKWSDMIVSNPQLLQLCTPKMTKYIPHKPTPKQAAFLMLDCLEAFYGGSASGGKATSVQTCIPHLNGWKTMGDTHPGDVIFDEQGQPCRVLAESEVFYDHECYEVEFDTGEKIVCDADHLWHTFTYKERGELHRRTDEWRAARRARRPSRSTGKRPDLAARNAVMKPPTKPAPTGSAKTAREIAATLKARGGSHFNHAVRVCHPVQWAEQTLLIPPYVFGAWLGDGTKNAGSYACHIDDRAIVDRISDLGFKVNKYQAEHVWYIEGLVGKLRELGVYGNKHIPEQYMRASAEQRMELLRGLMDTDGNCDEDGGAEFCNTNPEIAYGCLELARSLGLKASITEGRAMLNGEDYGPRWRVKITTDVRIFHLERKAARQKLKTSEKQHWHYIVACRKVDPVPVKCIAVDSPSHQYLCSRSCIPTHNSNALLMAALQYVDVPGYSALILRKTFADLNLPGAIMDRAKEWLAPFANEVKWNEKDKVFRFPSGANLTFGYLEHENDKLRYQGSELQFCAFDELTHFTESSYTYLFSRLRKPAGMPVPLRMRAASNPGGVGSQWVYERCVNPAKKNKEIVFIPAKVDDNPHVDAESYRKSLENLDPVEKARLLHGDWKIKRSGLVYPDFEDRVVPPRRLPEGRHFGGIDWGFRAPFAAVAGVLDKNDVLWVYWERYTRNMTIQEHAAHLPCEQDILWFADSAQPEHIMQLRKLDFAVQKVPKRLDYGILQVSQRLRRNKMYVFDTCSALRQEVAGYHYPEAPARNDDQILDSYGVKIDENPVKENDHICDAMRYMVVGISKLYGDVDRIEFVDDGEKPDDSAPPIEEFDEHNWNRWDNPAFWHGR